MKVALVSSGSGSRGGGELYLRVLAQGLMALGYDVLVLIPDHPRMDEFATQMGAIPTRRFAFCTTYDRPTRALGAWADLRQRRRLTGLFATLDVDVLHINQQVAEDALDLVLAAAASGKPWLSTIHVGHAARDLGARLGGLRDRVTAHVLGRLRGHHIAVSTATCQQLTARLGPVTLHPVPNGVAVPDPDALTRARAQARADWGVDDDTIVLGTVGRIAAQKAPLALVDHTAATGQTGVQLVWIGDGDLRDSLTARAAKASLPLHVDGWRDDAALRLAGLDIFVLPSLFEGLPLALLEAMHAGLPIAASRADGIAEALTHPVTGLMCDSDDDWRDALQRLITDQALRLRLGAAARAAAEDRFSAAAMARATADLYAQVQR
ncbi:Glycosyltransferase involved in cell wall bisynthesis [Loktanella sp. DSM 29012]|uniref:glycosyltransferase family 4 protein n=1 Tax=Loktanella sp. DSM 29012 TaxID=1881056 RepID=UPI0008C2CE0D|nr:glycosyltransferase family 4 protein [Loktanella sp. DSM 29012]SEQ78544.1 Glycosyltransferase involved in cell wall bisynthesis [Loktanella sp. DSM 29012]